MKLHVPFYKQTSSMNCGVLALRMVLSYYGKDLGIKLLDKLIETKEGKGIYTVQLATTAASLGYYTELFSTHDTFNADNLKHEFYNTFGHLNFEDLDHWFQRSKRVGVNHIRKTLSIKKLLKYLMEDSIPIVLVDWNVIRKRQKDGYFGHYIPVVGYDDKNIYIHNPSLNDAQEFMPIPRSTFDKARKADGTDGDVIVVHRKND